MEDNQELKTHKSNATLCTVLIMPILLIILSGCGFLGSQEEEPSEVDQTATALAALPTATPVLPTATPAPPTDTPTPTSTPGPSIENLNMLEKGFAQSEETLTYAFVVENPYPTDVFYQATYAVEAYDQVGNLQQTENISVALHLPEQVLGVTGSMTITTNTAIARIEVVPQSGWFQTISPNVSLSPLTVSRAGFVDKTLSTAIGIVNNPYPVDLPHLRVAVIAYDNQEQVVGGGQTTLAMLPANGQVEVTVPLQTASTPDGGVTFYPMVNDLSAIGLTLPATTTTRSNPTPPATPSTPVPTPALEPSPVSVVSPTLETTTTPTNEPEQTATGAATPEPVNTPAQEVPPVEESPTLSATATIEATATETPTEQAPTNTPATPTEERDEADEEPTSNPTHTPTDTPTPEETEEAPTDTPTPEEAEEETTPTPPAPSGDCEPNAPDEPSDVPIAWLTEEQPKADSSATLCVWVVQDNQPVEGATVEGTLLYVDTENEPQEANLEEATTDEDGIAMMTISIPETTEGEIDLIVTVEDETYHWEDYTDELALFFYTESE